MRLEKIVYFAMVGMSMFHPVNSAADSLTAEKAVTRTYYSRADIKKRVEETAMVYGVDPYFASAVAFHESGYRHVLSPAIGTMQLMPETAEYLGVDPYNLEQNIDGGVRYLKELEEKYGDKRTASAAYCAGPYRVDRLMKWYGENGWFEKLGRRTRAYVRNVMKTYNTSATSRPVAFVHFRDYDHVE